MKTRLLAAGVASLFVAACGGSAGAPPSASHPPASISPSGAPASSSPGALELTVYAAASLKGALEQAEAAYEAAKGGTDLVIATDSSSALETKIEQGAPADVFLSADTSNPQKLADRGSGRMVRRSRLRARTVLTVVVPTDDPGRASRPRPTWLGPGIKIVAAGDERAHHQVRQAAHRQPGQGGGIPRRLRGRICGQRRIEGGQRQGRHREDRAGRG